MSSAGNLLFFFFFKEGGDSGWAKVFWREAADLDLSLAQGLFGAHLSLYESGERLSLAQ
jgi:hypothetical protein